MLKTKVFWIVLILLDTFTLVYGFLKKDMALSLLALLIVLVIRYFGGYELLFSSFDREWDQKRKHYKKQSKENS